MNWKTAAGTLFAALVVQSGCTDRLAQMQAVCQGTWVLQSRELPDGRILRPPQIQGSMAWVPIDSRKAHVVVSVAVEPRDGQRRMVDYAASVYEISTSAITRKRHMLIRQGYRASSLLPFSSYLRAKTAKGKITAEGAEIRMSHTAEDETRGGTPRETFAQVYKDGQMVATYTDTFTDTWERVASP